MADSQRYLIEVAGKVAGLVVQEDRGYRFFNSSRDFTSLDRLVFRSPAHAESVCSELSRQIQKHTAASRWMNKGLAGRYHHNADVPQERFIPEGVIPYGWPFMYH